MKKKFIRKLTDINKEYNKKWNLVLKSVDKTKFNKERPLEYLKELNLKWLNPIKVRNPEFVLHNNVIKADQDTKMFFFINYFSDLIFKLTDNYNYVIELGSGSGLRSVVGSNKTKFISCEINKYGRLVQKKISKKLNKNTLEIEFDFNKIKTLGKFKHLKKKCFLSFTFFEQISQISDESFRYLSKTFKNTDFFFFEPIIFKNDKNPISKFNQVYCFKNKYNSNLLSLLKKYGKNIKIKKNLFCFSYSPNNLKNGANVISLIKGRFK